MCFYIVKGQVPLFSKVIQSDFGFCICFTYLSIYQHLEMTSIWGKKKKSLKLRWSFSTSAEQPRTSLKHSLKCALIHFNLPKPEFCGEISRGFCNFPAVGEFPIPQIHKEFLPLVNLHVLSAVLSHLQNKFNRILHTFGERTENFLPFKPLGKVRTSLSIGIWSAEIHN